MKLDRGNVEKALEIRFIKITRDSSLRDLFCKIAKETRSIPYSVAVDMVDMRIPPQELTDAELFWCLKILDDNAKQFKIGPYAFTRAFTKIEIDTYDALQFKEKKIKFPLVFDMIEVAQDQWIGTIDTQTLMLLRRAQMVNYNANIQRTLKRKTRGDLEYWTISINEKAVNSISELLKEGAFIPNTLTLNIPVDDYEAKYYYDKEAKQFVIKKLDHFDITDGYHRFLALCRQSDINKDFQYPMELRITNFTVERGQQFIFQEDQKTQMKRSEADSMDRSRVSNIITDRVNENSLFYLKGNISRGKGLIQYSEFSDIVEYLWVPHRLSETEKRKISVELPKKIIEWINALCDIDESYLVNSYTTERLVSVLVAADVYNFNAKPGLLDVVKNIESQLKGAGYKSIKRRVREARSELEVNVNV